MKSIIILLLVILVSMMLSTTRNEGFVDQKLYNIDDLRYGHINDKIREKSTRKISSFPMPLPLGSIKGPPKNSSSKTQKELKFLSELTMTQVDYDKRQLVKKFDQDGILKYFVKFAGQNGLAYDQTMLETLSKDIDTLCIKTQMVYNRPRPIQLALIYQTPITTVNSQKTPSYPSCETLKSKLFAHLLAYNNPTRKEELHSLAKEVELSRLYGGYNYQSDIDVALEMAEVIKKSMKYLETEQKKK